MPDDAGGPAAAGGDAGEGDRHEPFPASDLGANTPKPSKKRTQTSDVWKLVRRLRGAEGSRAMNLVTQGFTHVCICARDSDERPCNQPLKLTLEKGAWKVTQARRHFDITSRTR